MGVFVDDNGESLFVHGVHPLILRAGSNYFLSSADSNNIQINNINAGNPITIGTRVADLGEWHRV